MSRDTSTGQVLEAMVLPALRRGGYICREQVRIGERPNGRAHNVDVIAEKDNQKFLVSLKWQQTSGTAEQKVPYEVICLIKSVRESNGEYSRAYIVLGGPGWTLRDYYTSGDLSEYLQYEEYVSIITLEDFIAMTNRGNL